MKVELITKDVAMKRANALKEVAFSIAEASNTLPGYCNAKECMEFVDYLSVTQLRGSEVCLFIDGLAARILTEFEIMQGSRVIGKLCGQNIFSAKIEKETLVIDYADGVKEYYTYNSVLDCWEFGSNNTSYNHKLPNLSIN